MMEGTANGPIFQSGGGPRTLERHEPQSSAEVADIVSHAHASRTPLRIAGAGHWLAAGRPVRASSTLSLGRLEGIVEYVPGDLTITARAGTPLSDIAAATREHRQWLPLDPAGSANGTIGATLATASCGPLAGAIGHPRDLALGMEVVDGRGTVIRAGGRVVKNVAGFDLVRMQIGAWGTLGVITEVTVRLRGLPETAQTLWFVPPLQALSECVRTLRSLAEAPLTMELVNESLARHLGLPQAVGVLLHLGGNAGAVGSAIRSLAKLGDAIPIADDVWRALAMSEPADATVLRLSVSPATLGTLWNSALAICDGQTRLQATIARGVLRVVLPEHGDLPRWTTLAPCIVERTSATQWSAIPPAADDRLSRGLRAAMDPLGILNPGLMGT